MCFPAPALSVYFPVLSRTTLIPKSFQGNDPFLTEKVLILFTVNNYELFPALTSASSVP